MIYEIITNKVIIACRETSLLAPPQVWGGREGGLHSTPFL